MQHTTTQITSRAVATVIYVQHAARRGAAATAECRSGLLSLHQGRLEVLRREREQLLRARHNEMQARRLESVRNAYAAASFAAA